MSSQHSKPPASSKQGGSLPAYLAAAVRYSFASRRGPVAANADADLSSPRSDPAAKYSRSPAFS